MKLYHDYKKQFENIFFVFFLGILLIIPIVFSYAQTADEINTKISQRNTDISKLEEEIRQYQNQLDNLGKQKNSLNGSIQQLDITRKKLNADISITETKIDKTNLKIKELSLQINDKQKNITSNVDALTSNIKKINEIEENDVVATLLSEDTFTNVWNDIDNMSSVGKMIKNLNIELSHSRT